MVDFRSGDPVSDEVAVIVPAHRGGPVLDACLRAVADQRPAPAEFVVVADGPGPGADPELRTAVEQTGARLVVSPVPGGPSRARNVGAAATSAPLLFFVDSDVVLGLDACARVQAVFADREIDALFGSYDTTPGDPGFTSQYKNLVHHVVHQRARRNATTFWGACGAVRRVAFAAAGGFNESYRRPCIEDIELGYRLHYQGSRAVVEPGLQVTHLKRWTVRGLLRTDLWDRAVPWSTLTLRSRTVVDDLGTERRARAQVALSGLCGMTLLAASRLGPPAALAAAGLGGAVLALDQPVLAGLMRVRGPGFALRSVPWRVAHHGICVVGLGIALGAVGAERAGLRRTPRSRLRPRAELLGLRPRRTAPAQPPERLLR